MTRWCASLLLAVAMLISPARGAEPEQVDQAIKKGIGYLYSKQKDGNWEDVPARDPTTRPVDTEGGQWGGITALVTYALLASGESHEEPHVKQAIQFLLKADIIGTYALGMRAQVWNLLPKTSEVKQAMNKDMRLLKASLKTNGPARGLYDYVDNNTARYDHSVSQYGVLGMWACAENIEGVGPDYWKMVDEAWRRDQRPSGAWAYQKEANEKHPETLGMTAAGVATLFLTQDFLSRGKNLDPNGNAPDEDIEKGIKWISDHYQKLYEPDKSLTHHPYYTLYGIERIGVASGYMYIGGVNWYDSGADYLLKNQGKDGKWGSIINTSFSLLFLSRGRAPVVMNKLEYAMGTGDKPDAVGNWNQRPRDAANVAKFIGRQIERGLNWQIVNLKAPVDELHDSPILYISGNQTLNFSDEQKQKIKEFIGEGGLLVANADAGAKPFAESIKKLATEMFKYEFRPLPAGHVIFTDEQFPAAKWKRKPNVLGLSNGVRELVLLMPDGDAARYWQAYDIAGHSEMFELMADVFLYAIDKQGLRNRGESYFVRADEKIKPLKTIKLARVQYEANWDPEPAGWTRLAGIMRNTMHIELQVQPVQLKKLASGDAKVAHLTGTSAFKWGQEERDAIKAYVKGGGVLIVDSAGGSREFADSIESEFDTIFGDDAKALKSPLDPDDPIYKKFGKLTIAYRAYAQRHLTGDLKNGRVRIMQQNGKPAIIYSPEDLSMALVGEPVDGVLGYSPQCGTSLMTNIVVVASGK